MIDNIEYANAYSEVLEILRYVSIKNYNKIPERKIKVFEENANKNYKFNFNPSKTLDQQNVSKRARAILGVLFRDYWATEMQREKIKHKQDCDRKILEKQRKEKYDLDNIFNDKKTQVIVDNIENDRLQLVEYKENALNKFIKFVKRLLNLK